MFGSFRFFQRHHSKCRMNLFLPLLFVSVPLSVYGAICPQRGKNQGKSDKIFFYTSALFGTDDKMLARRVFLFHVRAYVRAFQQRC